MARSSRAALTSARADRPARVKNPRLLPAPLQPPKRQSRRGRSLAAEDYGGRLSFIRELPPFVFQPQTAIIEKQFSGICSRFSVQGSSPPPSSAPASATRG